MKSWMNQREMKKKKNKKLIEERCFKKDIEIHMILQNLK